MNKKKSIVLWLICGLLWLFSGTAFADTMGGSAQGDYGQTEITVGVVVNYMGKLRFEVYQKNTKKPIPGVSVELYISSLDRYVLLGVTNEQGVYELDAAYDMSVGRSARSAENQFVTKDGTVSFQGNILYLNSNEIKYQIYKAGWLPYPTQGELLLESKEVPQKEVIYLYQKDDGDGPENPKPPIPPVPPKEPGGFGKDVLDSISKILTEIFDQLTPTGRLERDGSIPKTGVEGAMQYWILGLLFFLMAGGILWYLIRKEQKIKEKERRSQNETV